MALANLVRVTCATTGTGTLTLGSAVQGFLTPSQAGMIDGRSYDYAIEAAYVTVGDDSVPTAREVGFGTYTISGTTLTRNVINSTNSNALLNLTGDAQVIVSMHTHSVRELLTSNRTYYVRTDGSDANNGLTNNSGGAFLTLQHAMDVLAGILDFGGNDLTVQVGAGTYTAGVAIKAWNGGGTLSFVGDTATPSNVVISVTGNHCFYVGSTLPGQLFISGFKLTTTTSGDGVFNNSASGVQVDHMEFGAIAASCLECSNSGNMYVTGPITISGSTGTDFANIGPATVFSDATYTLTGTPNWGVVMIGVGSGGLWQDLASFSGAATGKRYSVDTGGGIDTFAQGINHFPGSVAGTADAATYGWYR